MSQVVTRFPPSPTGYLHIGGARTALFNFLLARKSGGRFVLRIEDTDTARSTPEMTQAILDGMSWLGLSHDDGPYFQSERQDLYNANVDALLANGHAYWCQCTPEDVQAMRDKAMAEGRKPKYDGRCRNLGLGPGPGRCVRLKTPQDGATSFMDMVKGPVSFPNAELDDLVIRRADGGATYHMAVVSDDHAMGVTHVLRGDDHLNNTPRQIHILQALGFPLPVYGHVPMILGPDKKKLSKRHGAMSVMEYEKMGFLPEGVVNYLARLGWAHGDQEIFTLEELVAAFSTANLNSSAACFDMEKMLWVNAHHLRAKAPAELAPLLARFVRELGLPEPAPKLLEEVIPMYQPRAQTLKEMAEAAAFFFTPDADLALDPAAKEKFLTAEGKTFVTEVRDLMAGLAGFTAADIEAALHGYVEAKGVKFKLIAQPIRVALTGKTASPGLYETMAALGQASTLARLDRALA
jgi:glutamyl-tRNA synthetase